jgi:hypothetical protein
LLFKDPIHLYETVGFSEEGVQSVFPFRIGSDGEKGKTKRKQQQQARPHVGGPAAATAAPDDSSLQPFDGPEPQFD